MLKEVCVENFTNVPLMIERGAERIELNNGLANGGTTPSFDVIKKTVEYAHKYNASVIVMVRPRSGNFIYAASELEIMNSNIQMHSLLRAGGIAFGCLTDNKQLDKIATKKLITTAHAGNLEVVMHMAFGELTASKQKKALEWLSKNKIVRVLTHGGSLDRSIINCFENLKKLNKQTEGEIEILPSSDMTDKSVNSVIEKVDVTQAHGTKILGKI